MILLDTAYFSDGDHMGLTIHRTPAKLGIETTRGFLQINTQNAQLELHQKHARVNIKTERPRVLIDQYEAFASSGLKNMRDLSKELALRAYNHIIEHIGKVAADGDLLAAIERGGNPIAEISERDAYTEHEFGYDYMPKTGPKFDVTGDIQFDPEPNGAGIHNGVEGRYTPGDVDIAYTPARVNIWMVQYPHVTINYTGKHVDVSA